jgi:hypothetical protein
MRGERRQVLEHRRPGGSLPSSSVFLPWPLSTRTGRAPAAAAASMSRSVSPTM